MRQDAARGRVPDPRRPTEFNEPGALITFEETGEELAQNVRSLSFDLGALAAENKIAIDYIRVERSEIAETGEYDLEGLFLRLGRDRHGWCQAHRARHHRIAVRRLRKSGGAALELRRLFRFLKDRGVTGSSPASAAKAHPPETLEEYVSDCVILLDHRVTEQTSTRRMRIVKYRGTWRSTRS